MEKIEFNFDLPNISDILEEKVDFNSLFHFNVFQKLIEEFIKRQNLMNQKINSLEVKFESWSLTHDIINTDESNKVEVKTKIQKENLNQQDESNKNNDFFITENNSEINEKINELSKKVKKLELVNKEMAQRIVVNNNQNNDNISKFIDSSEDKIKQFHITLKNLENKLNEKERLLTNQSNKSNQLIKKIEQIESTIEENKKNMKNINSDIYSLQRLKLEDFVNEFYKFQSQNNQVTNDLKNFITEKIDEFKKNILLQNSQNSDINNDNNNKNDIQKSSGINEFELKEMSNQLKNYFINHISTTEKNIKKLISDLNIDKINNNINNINQELKEKLTQKNLNSVNIHLEDVETKLIDFNSKISEFKFNLDHLKEHSSKIDKNEEYLSLQLNTCLQLSKQKEKNNIDFINKEGMKIFVKKDDYDEDMTKILKKIEKILLFQQENLRKIESQEKKMKLFVTDKDLKNIEHYTLNMMQEFKINAIKKFLDKKEGYKSLKLLGLQIQNINEYLNLNNTNVSTDRILMNRPLSNMFCPSCDSKMNNNTINKNEYMIKNKEKDLNNYRMGQGFSHMLQLINSDLMKSAEKINDDTILKVEDIPYNNEVHNKSSIDNKSLPRLNSQKSFSLLNAEAKNNDLDTSNNNSSRQNNLEKSIKSIKNNSFERIINLKEDIKSKVFRRIDKENDKGNKNRIVYTKLKKGK